MTWEIPWAITGVDEIPLSTARLLAYIAAHGDSGVIGPDDLKVSATTTPSNQVQTASGAFVVVSDFLASPSESYAGRNTGTVLTNVPNTSGSPRYDFVYAHITDPGKAGQPATAAPVETRVVTNVSSTAKYMADVPSLANQAGLPLARIYRGPSATIVNSGDITDLRSVVVPKFTINTRNSTSSSSETINSTSFVDKPATAAWTIDIPSWATTAVLDIDTVINPTFTTSGASFELIAKIGTTTSISTAATPLQSWSGANGSASTQQTIAVPAALRGTTQPIVIQTRLQSGSGTLTWSSSVVNLGITFQNTIT